MELKAGFWCLRAICWRLCLSAAAQVPAARGPLLLPKKRVSGAHAENVIKPQSLLDKAPCYWVVFLPVLMAGYFKALQGFLAYIKESIIVIEEQH